MSDFSFNNEDSITNADIDIDIDNIIDSLNNEKNNINYFTKKLENELSNYNTEHFIEKDNSSSKIPSNIPSNISSNTPSNIPSNMPSKNNILSIDYNILNKINKTISKDIFLYTLIFIIIELLFINKLENKYLFFIIKICIFIISLLIIKKCIII